MLVLVINPEYSWLGTSPDGVLHDTSCTDPNGLLEIKCPCNTVTAYLFKQHPRKDFIVVRKG